MASAPDLLSTYLGPLGEELTAQQAERILSITPAPSLMARVHFLADKASAGTLSEPERAEYEYYVDVDDIIGVLKAKARQVVESQTR